MAASALRARKLGSFHACPGFPGPVSSTVFPYPFVRPAHIRDSFARLAAWSGGRASPVDLLCRRHGPDDPRRPVGQRHGDQHSRLPRQHPGEPEVGRLAPPDPRDG